MEITALTWYFLISAAIFTIAVIYSTVHMLLLYRRKRTSGTLLLTITYSAIAMGELFNTIGLYYFVFISDTNNVSGYLELLFPLMYGLAYLYFYFFANRHIMDDNDVVKSVTSVTLTAIIVAMSLLMFAELSLDLADPIFYNITLLKGPNIDQYHPSLLTGAAIFLPIFLFVHLRLIINLIKMKRSAEDPITKTGLNFILYTIIGFVSSALIASLFTLPFIGEYPLVITLMHSLRILALAMALISGNIGWAMPKWLVNRIKRKMVDSEGNDDSFE